MPLNKDGTFDDGTSFTNSGTGTGTPNTPGLYYDPSVTGDYNPNQAGPYSDVTYDDALANTGPATGPQIDQTVSDQSRNVSMDALGILRNTAQGGITPAQQLQAQQTAGAVNAVGSGAASIAGGAQARAAASMAAGGVAQRTAATGAQDQAALAAKEQAAATTQYFGGANTQRTTDLGAAASQAALNSAQRSANEQRSENYEGMGFAAQKAITDRQLNKSAEQIAAENAMRASVVQQRQTSLQQSNDAGSAATGGANGLINALKNTNNSGTTTSSGTTDDGTSSSGNSSDNPWDPSNYSGSDPLMKTNVKPVSDKEAARLRQAAEDMETQQRASLAAPTAVGRVRARAQEAASTPFVYDGKYLQPDAPPPPHKPTLDEALATQVAKDREDMANAPMTYGLFSSDDAPKHPAGGWALGEGFSDDPSHNYSSSSSVGRTSGLAPGSEDFYAGSHSKDLMTSDPTAKRAAFVAGLQHANEAADTGHFGQLPDYMQEGAPKQQPKDTTVRKASPTVAPRADAAPQQAENNRAEDQYFLNNNISKSGMWFGPGAYLGAAEANREEDSRQAARGQNPQASFPERARSAVSDQLSRLYPERNVDLSQEPGEPDTTTSDPEAKDVHHFGGKDDPMANAARSMEASSYEYKPEYLPAEQKQGEVNVGPMADKMKADPVARTAIVTDPKSGLLAIDKTKALKVVMGSLSSLQRQVDGMRGAR